MSHPAFYLRPPADSPVARLSLIGEGVRAEWRLAGSPMVVSMASRLFLARPSKDRSEVTFPASAACFEDLLMLQHRFAIRVEAAAETRWTALLDKVRDRAFAEKSPVAEPLTLQPGHAGAIQFHGTLRPFQAAGVAFMRRGERTLLADEMGLGKTPQGLALLAEEIGTGVAVAVCQPHVQTHWERKIREFLRFAEADRGRGWVTLKGRSAKRLPPAAVYVVHYLNLSAWAEVLAGLMPEVVLFDEAQEMRHDGTDKYRACRRLSDAARVVAGLSGTPIYNAGPEIFNVMDALSPGCLNRKRAFQSEWCRGSMGRLYVEDPDALGRSLEDRGLMLRRRKETVLGELPAKRRVVQPITGDDDVFRDLVQASADMARRAAAAAKPFDRARMEQEAIEGTRRATGIAKAPAVAAFVRALMESDQPTLVFAHHHAVQDVLTAELQEFFPVRITGRETIPEKAAAQEAFVNGTTNLCLIGLRAATGLDGLQKRARVVVFAELDWSPAVHRQAEDRAHRMGQRDSVLCYYLVTDLGTDPYMVQGLELKQSQFDGLMAEPAETEGDRVIAVEVAEQHKRALLSRLRNEGPSSGGADG